MILLKWSFLGYFLGDFLKAMSNIVKILLRETLVLSGLYSWYQQQQNILPKYTPRLKFFWWDITCLKRTTRNNAYVIEPVILLQKRWVWLEEMLIYQQESCYFSKVHLSREIFPKLLASHLSISPASRILWFWCPVLIMKISFSAIMLIFSNSVNLPGLQ